MIIFLKGRPVLNLRLILSAVINSCMTSHAQAQAQTRAITEFLQQHARRITHVAVAHTRYTTYERTGFGMQRIVEQAKIDCRHFRNCLNKELYGRRATRKADRYQPLLIATLEGSLVNTDRDLTLHYNFAFGNLPAGIQDADFLTILRRCWVVRAGQRDNIFFANVSGNVTRAGGFLGYSLKEAEDRDNAAVWDSDNTQIPYAAFDAG